MESPIGAILTDASACSATRPMAPEQATTTKTNKNKFDFMQFYPFVLMWDRRREYRRAHDPVRYEPEADLWISIILKADCAEGGYSAGILRCSDPRWGHPFERRDKKG